MIRFLSFSVLLLGFLSSVGVVAQGADILAEERIGSMRIGLSEGGLMKAISCDFKHGRENLWGADGMYHQTWQCSSCGLNLGMVSETRGGKKVIESIALTAPCALATARGIRIGSTEQEVRKAYGTGRTARRAVASWPGPSTGALFSSSKMEKSAGSSSAHRRSDRIALRGL